MLPPTWPIDRDCCVAAICSLVLYWALGARAWASLALGCGLQPVLTAVSHFFRDSSTVAASEAERLPTRTRANDPVFAAADLLHAIPDAAIILHRDGLILSANETARDQLQLSPGEDLKSSLRSPELASALSRRVTDGTPATVEIYGCSD